VYVCHCKAVSDRAIAAVIASGARTVAEVTDGCRAGGGCGGCHPLLQAMIDGGGGSQAGAEPVLSAH
jgi:bacterioferritin-associated ferredoxin